MAYGLLCVGEQKINLKVLILASNRKRLIWFGGESERSQFLGVALSAGLLEFLCLKNQRLLLENDEQFVQGKYMVNNWIHKGQKG